MRRYPDLTALNRSRPGSPRFVKSLTFISAWSVHCKWDVRIDNNRPHNTMTDGIGIEPISMIVSAPTTRAWWRMAIG
jgi:hypothetical protein